MRILQKGYMLDGSLIQIEEWKENYPFMPYGSTLAAYTKSKMSHKGAFAPKGNEVYRFEFDFNSNEEAEEAFNNLIEGKSLLSEYKQYISRPEYTDCI